MYRKPTYSVVLTVHPSLVYETQRLCDAEESLFVRIACSRLTIILSIIHSTSCIARFCTWHSFISDILGCTSASLIANSSITHSLFISYVIGPVLGTESSFPFLRFNFCSCCIVFSSTKSDPPPQPMLQFDRGPSRIVDFPFDQQGHRKIILWF